LGHLGLDFDDFVGRQTFFLPFGAATGASPSLSDSSNMGTSSSEPSVPGSFHVVVVVVVTTAFLGLGAMCSSVTFSSLNWAHHYLFVANRVLIMPTEGGRPEGPTATYLSYWLKNVAWIASRTWKISCEHKQSSAWTYGPDPIIEIHVPVASRHVLVDFDNIWVCGRCPGLCKKNVFYLIYLYEEKKRNYLWCHLQSREAKKPQSR